jgi:hypothetical protein
MTKAEEYRQALRRRDNWVPFLLKESGLPGPRGNLELAHAVAHEGNKQQFETFLSFDAEENTPEVFLVFCGVIGLGRLAAREPHLFKRLREYACDPRWRIREAVATGLQLVGDTDMDLLLREMLIWIQGNWYEKRAAAAALAEPRLLKQPEYASNVLQILDQITASIENADQDKSEAYKVLRQAMAYCWSVAVVALPGTGKPIMERWADSQNRDIRWVIRENLKKNRLIKMDPMWVKACHQRLEHIS